MTRTAIFINTGALDYNTGERIKTKAELKKYVQAKADVIFDQTAVVHSDILPGHIDLRDLINLAERRTDWELSVVGPDPYRKRQWYATVYVNRNGDIAVR